MSNLFGVFASLCALRSIYFHRATTNTLFRCAKTLFISFRLHMLRSLPRSQHFKMKCFIYASDVHVPRLQTQYSVDTSSGERARQHSSKI